jgi:hypothetical protein
MLIERSLISKVSKSRLVAILAACVLLVAAIVVVRQCMLPNKGRESMVAPTCYADADCPDDNVCSNGYCVPVGFQSLWDHTPAAGVLGRGRAGENDVEKVTKKTQGQ